MTPEATVGRREERPAVRVGRRPGLADASREDADAAPGTLTEPAPAEDLVSLATAAGLDLPRLARALGLGRGPLVDLVRGRVSPPVPVAVLAALADALGTTMPRVEAATRDAPARSDRPEAGIASSAPRRPFADVLRDDPSTPADVKARWLTLIEED